MFNKDINKYFFMNKIIIYKFSAILRIYSKQLDHFITFFSISKFQQRLRTALKLIIY